MVVKAACRQIARDPAGRTCRTNSVAAPRVYASHLFVLLPLKVDLLGFGSVPWEPMAARGLWVQLPALSPGQMRCQWAWALRITGAT